MGWLTDENDEPATSPAGIYVPILCFFRGDNQEEIDHDTLAKHVQR